MSPITPVMLELLTWIATRPRTYAETMDAWRSNCPRHPVWDDACVAGLVEVTESGQVLLTARGRALIVATSTSAD